MKKKLIFWEHAVETLGYFSRQLETFFLQKGYQTCFVDHNRVEACMSGVREFYAAGETAFLTFNFIGLSGETECQDGNGRTIWENLQIPCYCIMVDHPFYYYKQLQGYKNMSEEDRKLTTFCVDRTHVAYMKRFYPEISCYFLPLAGNTIPAKDEQTVCRNKIPYSRRQYDISFIANYVPLENLERHLGGQPQEYRDLYMEMIEDLKQHPWQQADDVMEKFIRREIPDVTDSDLCSAQAGIMIIDLYIRSYFRRQVIRELTDAGLKVYVFGKDWEKLECRHRENLIVNGRMLTSAECVEVIRNTKLALNVMPWFKDGAHDRIFTAMRNGAVSLTDDSIYLQEILSNGENVVFYNLSPDSAGVDADMGTKSIYRMQFPTVAEQAYYWLEHEKSAEEIAGRACIFAEEKHTWWNRGACLEQYLGIDE